MNLGLILTLVCIVIIVGAIGREFIQHRKMERQFKYCTLDKVFVSDGDTWVEIKDRILD